MSGDGTTDAAAFGAFMADVVPFVKTLGIAYDEVGPQRAVLRMPDEPAHRNHVGTPHAGALFSLGESASGAIVASLLGDRMADVTPLARNADIAYRALARGEVTAEATFDRDAAEVLADLDRDGRVDVETPVVLRDETGAETTELRVRWSLRRNR